MIHPSLKILLLAICFSVVVPVFHIALNVILRERRKDFLCMFGACLSYLMIVFSFVVSQGYDAISVAAGILTVIFMSLLYAEFFSMICRGFSLNMLVAIYQAKSLTTNELCYKYGDKGMQWMLTKRLSTMQSFGLVSVVGNQIILKNDLARGIGKFGLYYKRLLNLSRGG